MNVSSFVIFHFLSMMMLMRLLIILDLCGVRNVGCPAATWCELTTTWESNLLVLFLDSQLDQKRESQCTFDIRPVLTWSPRLNQRLISTDTLHRAGRSTAPFRATDHPALLKWNGKRQHDDDDERMKEWNDGGRRREGKKEEKKSQQLTTTTMTTKWTDVEAAEWRRRRGEKKKVFFLWKKKRNQRERRTKMK